MRANDFLSLFFVFFLVFAVDVVLFCSAVLSRSRSLSLFLILPFGPRPSLMNEPNDEEYNLIFSMFAFSIRCPAKHYTHAYKFTQQYMPVWRACRARGIDR